MGVVDRMVNTIGHMRFWDVRLIQCFKPPEQVWGLEEDRTYF